MNTQETGCVPRKPKRMICAQCMDCGATKKQELFCPRCHPPFTGQAYPYLVGGPGRTVDDSLELAVAAAAPSGPVFYTALFKPTKGNGPYFADTTSAMVASRVAAADDPRYATIFKSGQPCYLHLDIDDTQPGVEHSPERALELVGAALDVIKYLFRQDFELDLHPIMDWLICVADYKNKKSSAHCHALKHAFKDVDHVKSFVARYKSFVEQTEHPTTLLHRCCSRLVYEKDGKKFHVLDASIYHNNALLKFPFQHKPNKPAMLPAIFKGDFMTPKKMMVQKEEIIRVAMAHREDIDTENLISISVPERVVAPAPPQPAVAAITELRVEDLQTLLPGASSSRFSKSTARGDFYYIKFGGDHTCPLGVLHKNNNGVLRVQEGGDMFFRCFGEHCKKTETKLVAPPKDGEEADLLLPPPVTPDQLKERFFEWKMELTDAFNTVGDHEEKRLLLRGWTQKFFDLFKHDWIQINRSKVLYGSRTRVTHFLDFTAGLDPHERFVERDDWVLRDKQNFVQATSVMVIQTPKMVPKTGTLDWSKPKPLAEIWLRWPHRPVYNDEIFEPNPSRVGRDTFNRWTPYLVSENYVKRYIASRKLTRDAIMKIINPWIEHMAVIMARGNLEHYQYQAKWWGKLLRYKVKLGTALLYMGMHGAGKSFVLDRFMAILGPRHAICISKGSDLTGDFNQHLKDKFLVGSEEATYGKDRKNHGMMKNLITSKKFIVHEKFRTPVRADSFHNVVFLANPFQHVVRIEETERRMACFNVSSQYGGIQTTVARDYFDNLAKIPLPLIAWYYYFEIDSKDFNPATNMPVTQCTTDQKIQTIDSALHFLLQVMQRCSQSQWEGLYAALDVPALYDEYVRWYEKEKTPFSKKYWLNDFNVIIQRALHVNHNGRIHPNLSMNKLKFAAMLNMPVFPEIKPVRQKRAAPPSPTLTRERSLGEIWDDDGLSDTEIKRSTERLCKRRRLQYRPDCPSNCPGGHPEFVRIDPETKEITTCTNKHPQAIPWHKV